MKIVLDTNVFVSAVFFGGVPGRILDAWAAGRIQIVASAEILDEYQRVGLVLAAQYPGVDLSPVLTDFITNAEIVAAPPLAEPVSCDPDDDKFLACALAARVDAVVSGDRDLLTHDGWRGIAILKPRRFVDDYLRP